MLNTNAKIQRPTLGSAIHDYPLGRWPVRRYLRRRHDGQGNDAVDDGNARLAVHRPCNEGVVVSWQDVAFLGAGGFALGVLGFTAWVTTSRHVDERFPYALILIGAVICIAASIYVAVHYDESGWFEGLQLIGYAVIGSGLTMLVAIRRKRRK